MKTLNALEVAQVSGGDFDLTIHAFVPTGSAAYVGGVFQALVSGQMGSTADFVAALQNPDVSAAFNKVRIDTVSFANFN